MVKKASALAIAGIAFFSWASNTSMAKVDATTQATVHKNIKIIIPLTVAKDSAIVKWRDSLNRSASMSAKVVISHGTTTSTLTKDTVTATKLEDKVYSVNLKGLQPTTTYKIRVEVIKATGNPEGPCADTTTIATTSTTFTIRQIAEKKDISLELLDHLVQLGSMVKTGDHLIVSDCIGRVLFSRNLQNNEKALTIPSNAKGVYFMTYSRQGKVLYQKQFVITHR